MVRICVKCDELRRMSSEWQALKEAFPNLPGRFREAGVDDVEASVAMTGDMEEDRRRLDQIPDWYRPWQEAGMGLHLHPYTSGAANPAAYVPGENDIPLRSLLSVAELLAQLTEGSAVRPKLVYHAAEAREQDVGYDPRSERQRFLDRSRRFFDDAWRHIEREGWNVSLVTETQLPPGPERPIVRIGDRPEEIAAIVGDRPASVCMDTGHYLVARQLLGSEAEPGFLAQVGHMHLHDVDGLRDHRPLTPRSEHVARYVALAAARGELTSATLEYKLNRALPDPDSLDVEGMLRHLQQGAAWVRSWTASLEQAG